DKFPKACRANIKTEIAGKYISKITPRDSLQKKSNAPRTAISSIVSTDRPPKTKPPQPSPAWLFRHFPDRVHFLDNRKRCELAHIAVARLHATLMPGNELKSTGGPNESCAGRNCLILSFDYRVSS